MFGAIWSSNVCDSIGLVPTCHHPPTPPIRCRGWHTEAIAFHRYEAHMTAMRMHGVMISRKSSSIDAVCPKRTELRWPCSASQRRKQVSKFIQGMGYVIQEMG